MRWTPWFASTEGIEDEAGSDEERIRQSEARKVRVSGPFVPRQLQGSRARRATEWERTHRGSRKTEATNPLCLTRMLRTNPTAYHGNAPNKPNWRGRPHGENAPNEPKFSSGRPRGGTRQNEAISRDLLARTCALPAGSGDESFLRNEANHQVAELRRAARPTTKCGRTNPPTEMRKRDARTHRRSRKTRRTNPPGLGKNTTNEPTGVCGNVTNEPNLKASHGSRRDNHLLPIPVPTQRLDWVAEAGQH